MVQKERLKKFLPLVKLVISAGLIFLILKIVDVKSFKETLLGIRFLYFLTALAVMFSVLILAAYRWRLCMLPQGIDIRLGHALKYTLIGFFFNNFAPSTVGGDIAKGIIVGRSSKKGIGTAVSIIMDRLTGLLAMGTMALFALLISINLPIDKIIRMLVILFVFIVLVFQYLIFHKRFASKVARLFMSLHLKLISDKIISVADSFYTYRTHSKFLKQTFIVSLIMWTGNILVSFILARGIGIELSFAYFLIIVPLILAIMSIPISFGGLGLRELAYISLFGMVGVSKESALAVSISFYVTILILSFVGGLLLLKATVIEPLIKRKEGK